MIEKYQFSSIVINGKTYTTDVVVTPSSVRDDWWRRDGHKLSMEDLEKIMKNGPEAIVVGTGYSGKMRVLPDVVNFAQDNNIELIVKNTEDAIEEYNKLENDKVNVIGCFHLTC